MNDTWYSLGSKHGPINGVKVVIVSKFVVLSLLAIAYNKHLLIISN